MTVADWTATDWIAGLACIAAAIGAFMPWAKVIFFSVSGTEGDGQIVLVAAVVALGLTAGFVAWRKLWMVILVALCGILIAFIGIYDAINIESLTDDSDGLVRVGEGLYIVIIAGIALTVAAGVSIYKQRQANIAT